MRIWGSLALAVIACSVYAASPADAASCRAKKGQTCFNSPAAINFGSVSDISREIVGAETAATAPHKTVLEAPPITTYTGPTVGVNSMVHAPTVGYYWSLEPDTKQ
jgi:hypothetical protein